MPGPIRVSPVAWLETKEATGATKPSAGGGSSSSGPTVAETQAQASLELPSGIVPFVFGIDNLPISQTNLQLYRALPGAAVVLAQVGVQPLYRGSIVGLALRANALKTAGTVTLTAFINAVASAAVLTWPSGANKAYATFPVGTYPYAAGDELDVRISTDGSFAPTTADLEALLYVGHFITESTPV